jgi:hypothetical protein
MLHFCDNKSPGMKIPLTKDEIVTDNFHKRTFSQQAHDTPRLPTVSYWHIHEI